MLADSNPLLLLSVVLVAGVAFGAIAKRLHLPTVTGQILVGILLGPAVLGIFSHTSVTALDPFIDFALGLMAVAVGSHLIWRRLRNARKRLTYMLALEATATPMLVFFAVVFLPDTSWQMAALLAAIAISTAPATILAIVKETHSKGVFVKTLVATVALNNLACILLFEVAHTATGRTLEAGAAQSMWSVLVAPVGQLFGAAVIGGGAGLLLVATTRHVVRPDRLTAASIVAILLTMGLSTHLEISPLLACLVLGITLANLTPDKEEIGHGVFANFEYAIFAIFFTLAGMELEFRYLVPGGLLAIVVFSARFLGKVASGTLAMRWAGATNRVRRYLGPALIPQAGLAVGLMLLVTEDEAFRSLSSLFLAVVLTTVLLNEIVGPLLTRYALARSGDLGKDRARLIDFLHEEHITTDLAAETKEEAIERLAGLLIETNHLKVEKQVFLDSVLLREKSASTCLGDGLAIPHGRLENGAEILGVMGISRQGLRFKTPDGVPVHCMVLLATPEGARDRHLEVLAAFARAIGSDRSVQQQLFHASSPAHAYELLHAEEESEDFNYFLEDDETV
ncbi:MAG: cation:proton antiporter domain-containing protein [Planctomycetota bacterium]|jgi:mannitol/fructose-specific phosphotransferase system IIA component (Ntr-type)